MDQPERPPRLCVSVVPFMTVDYETPTRRSFDLRTTIETFGPLVALIVLVIATTVIEHSTRDNPVFLSVFMGLVMTDIKQVVAYSTLNSLGLMMVALGFGEAGVGPCIASGSQTWKGNCADLPIAPPNKNAVATVR